MEIEEEKLTKKELREQKRRQKLLAREERKKQERTSRIVLWAIAIILVGGGITLAITLGTNSPNENNQVSASLANIITEEDHTKGNENATVTLVEYSDFQCPACATYSPLIKELEEEFKDDIKISYRHFPLTQIHPNALNAAKAAEAAGVQGKFWEMHDVLFERQNEWSGSTARIAQTQFEKYAEELELNIEQFKSDRERDEIKEKIQRDIQNGNQAGVNSTPTFFINEEKIENPQNYEELKQLIEAELPTPEPPKEE
jgi:protein-disulfide isomerase